MSIGQNIKRLRRNAEMTQEELEAIKKKHNVQRLWSWSRMNTYMTSKFEYLLKYILKSKEDRCDSSYVTLGTICHDTLDKFYEGEIEYENFNAAGATVHIYGRNVHPGSAKGKMKNAILIAQEFQSMLPVFQNPMYTEMYEGFYHLDHISGNVEAVQADYIIRDHDKVLFEEKKSTFLRTADFLNAKYGEGTVVVDMRDSYYNMRQILEPHMHLIENASKAMKGL